MQRKHRMEAWPSLTFVIILLGGSMLIGCRCNSTSQAPPAAGGISDPTVEPYYQFYLKSADVSAPNGRGGYWARVATRLSPTVNPNKVSVKTALHYLGNPDFVEADDQETIFAYSYVIPSRPDEEVLFVNFDAAGYVSQVSFTNRSAVDFSGWRRWGATTKPTR